MKYTHYAPRVQVANPWGLTPAQAEAMDAIVETGCHKLAAVKLGVEHFALRDRMKKIKQKMQSRSVLTHYIQWDRWRQSEGKGVPY